MIQNIFIIPIVYFIISNNLPSKIHTLDNISPYSKIHTLDKNNKNIKKGALDWFKEVQYIFPRQSDALVTDIETKMSFKVRRTFGTNHADVEPLTKKDGDIIKEIWGGKWSWERRAVIVKTQDGHILAGSMTAFPHAGLNNKPALAYVKNRSGGFGYGKNLDYIKDNGIDGHMDIHFLNSRTHKTNKISKKHQEMIKKASDYIKNNY